MEAKPLSQKQITSIRESDARINLWEGAVRSGKTIASILAWLIYIVDSPPGNLLMIGKTERTLRRNIIDVIAEIIDPADFKLNYGTGEAIIYGRKIYLVGANDERAEQKIRGLTLVGAYGDEVTLWPESFFIMLMSRLSEVNARFYGTTNPDSPAHWLKTDYIDRQKDINAKIWHFDLSDNLSLSEEFIHDLNTLYVGLWNLRFVKGLWVLAEGAIYDMFDEKVHIIHEMPKAWSMITIGVDYGTANPTSFIALGLALDGKYNGKWIAFKEYYFDGHTGRQKTDIELTKDMVDFLEGIHQDAVMIDPSAASLRLSLHREGIHGVRDADNAVVDGIRNVASGLTSGKLLIHESCKHLIDEMHGYVWDPKAQEKGIDKPIKSDDHALDALRYAYKRVSRVNLA